MKKFFTLVPSLLFFFFLEAQPKRPLEIEIFKQEGQQSLEFTSNRFSSINVSKNGVVWAGTIYQGLYRYDTKSNNPNNSWKKSTVTVDCFINDIKPDRFGGIWVAQSGNSGPGGLHIPGGVNHIPDPNRDSTVFYSISGTQTGGYLYSRNVVSICITDSNRTATGALPTDPAETVLFAAQGKSRSGGEIIRGGLSRYRMVYQFSPSFERIAGQAFFATISQPYEPSGWDGRSRGVVVPIPISTPYAECVGGNSKNEVWVAVRDNYDMTEIVRYFPDGKPKGRNASYNHTNSPLSQYSQPMAIHFDEAKNRWITTRNDGIMVLMGDTWAQVKLGGFLPAGTVFNRNAIAEDEWGNVYFGTSAGLVVYKSAEFSLSFGPDNVASYERFTTDDGLPGNNITGLAYDKINGKILVAVDGGGVAFINIKPDNIEGVAYDVYTDVIKKSAPYSSNFKKLPISNAATVKLFENGQEVESVKPDHDGNFKFTKDKPNKNYTVEVEFTNKDQEIMKYIYQDVKSQSKVPPAYFPDSLIRELKVFKDSMARRCIEYKLLTILPFQRCRTGFIVNFYDNPYAQFFDPSGINKDHKKRVDNLGIYMANLKSVYDLGGNATELAVEGLDNGWSLLKSLKSIIDTRKAIKGINDNKILKLEDEEKGWIEAGKMIIKGMKSSYMTMMDFVYVLFVHDEELRKVIKKVNSALSDAFDFALQVMEIKGAIKSGAPGDIIPILLDLLSKVVTVEIGSQIYKDFYAQGVHEFTIPEASIASIKSKSDLTYNEVNVALVSPNGESTLKKAQESLEFHKQTVSVLNSVATISANASQTELFIQALLVVPGAQPVAVAALGLAKAAKGLEIAALGSAMAVDFIGFNKQVDFSKKVLDKSGINGLEASKIERKRNLEIRRDPFPPSQDEPVKLFESKNNYNQKVFQMQTLANTPNFSANDYNNLINELTLADSVYLEATNETFNKLLASSDSAFFYVPGFEEKFKYLKDSFITKQPHYKYAFLLNQMALVIDKANAPSYILALDSTANELKALNDSIYVNVLGLINLINENGISAPAFLQRSNYALDHEFEPGTPGTFMNTYTNYGKEAMRNVSFKINVPTEEFSITSADSIYIGDIAPGASVQISFNFNSPPSTDSVTIGRYEIDIKADNGEWRNTTGSLMIIKKESLPVTLINFNVDCSGTNTELNWETTSESNSSHFEIEKSSNGIDWIVVRRVTTSGNSSIRRLYKLMDQSSENSFYRLKHVDLDGKYTYSNVLRSKCGIERPMISVYPVPAKDVVNIIAVATKASVAKVLLLDITGREVRRLSAALQAGTNTIKLNISSLPSGQYILKVDGTEINKSMKITISK